MPRNVASILNRPPILIATITEKARFFAFSIHILQDCDNCPLTNRVFYRIISTV